MNFFDIIILAFALSIDACVVSFSYGLIFEKEKRKNALLLASFTGFFQGIMPIIGYFFTELVRSYIQPFAKYIVFLIFVYLGAKFIIEALQKEKVKQLYLDLKCLFFIGIATSIDAFSAGISLSLFGNHILKPAILIAIVTFINSILGFIGGYTLKLLPTKILEIFAGILLICLGLKALM